MSVQEKFWYLGGKSIAWAHSVTKGDLVKFLCNFNAKSCLSQFKLDDLRNAAKHAEGLKGVKTLTKEDLINGLLKYNQEGILNLIDIDVLRTVAKKIISEHQELKLRELETSSQKIDKSNSENTSDSPEIASDNKTQIGTGGEEQVQVDDDSEKIKKYESVCDKQELHICY